MTAKKPHYVFACDTVSVREPGSKYPTQEAKGSAWHAECPLVLAYPDLFSTTPTDVHPRNWESPVKQATAAPGEKRATRRAD